MGAEGFYPEERPTVDVSVDALWMDEHPVTNAEFAKFVADTGYVTVAERSPELGGLVDEASFPIPPGSLVFVGTAAPVPLDDWRRWWRWIEGADWHQPQGPASNLEGLDRHPVVHVGIEDAIAYAEWTGKRLPTEVEWEHAARGGLDGAVYAWGDEFAPGGVAQANVWVGHFPYDNRSPYASTRTSPVRSFPPNGYGLYDVTGNVWEWTVTPWVLRDQCAGPHGVDSAVANGCCPVPVTILEADRFVIKGGSHLCAASYCHRYRPAARQGQGARDTASHLGFRCVRSAE